MPLRMVYNKTLSRSTRKKLRKILAFAFLLYCLVYCANSFDRSTTGILSYSLVTCRLLRWQGNFFLGSNSENLRDCIMLKCRTRRRQSFKGVAFDSDLF